MNKIGTDYGIFRIAHDISVAQALMKAVHHMKSYGFEPNRPDLLPDPRDIRRVYYGFPNVLFKREELSGVGATLKLNFETIARVKGIELEEGERLQLYQPYIEISWSTSFYTPAEAVLAGRITGEAGVAGIGLPGAMAGTWMGRGVPVAFPAGVLDDTELTKLLGLIGVE